MKGIILGAIKAHWGTLLIIALCAIVLLSYDCSNSRKEKEKAKQAQITELAKVQSYKLHFEDSLKAVLADKQLKEIEATKAIEAEKTNAAKAIAKYHESQASKLKSSNAKLQSKLDSLIRSGTAPCIDMLEACIENNGGLRKEIAELDKENQALDSEAQGYSRQLYLCEAQNVIKDSLLFEKDVSINALQGQISLLVCYRDRAQLNFFQRIFTKKCK